jgi:hypothetical protein
LSWKPSLPDLPLPDIFCIFWTSQFSTKINLSVTSKHFKMGGFVWMESQKKDQNYVKVSWNKKSPTFYIFQTWQFSAKLNLSLPSKHFKMGGEVGLDRIFKKRPKLCKTWRNSINFAKPHITT